MEGADRTGKTEIGMALANEYNLSYFKNSNEMNNFKQSNFYNTVFVEGFYIVDLLKQASFKENGIIFDRSIPSEWVYANVFKRKTAEDLIWKLDDDLASLHATIIYCYKTQYNNYDDEVIDETKIKYIKQYYEQYFEKTKMHVISIDTTDEDLDREIKELKEQI